MENLRKLKFNLLLFFIVLIAIFFRFFQLGVNPPSLTWDEAAWGYNAYSIGIDGKDEFGRFLPYDYLESFGDFKPPMYAYLDVIPIKVFGLNEFAVRFPSALFGVLTVLVSYFLVKQIFRESLPSAKVGKINLDLAILSSFILAISPWHIMLSRAAFEANVSTLLIICGVWLFLLGVNRNKFYLILSAASFSLSFYTFNSARIVSPILAIILVVGFRKQVFPKKELFFAFFVAIIMLLPISRFLISSQAQLRYQEVNIFSDTGVIRKINQEVLNDNNSLYSKIIHNRRFAFAVSYLNHYLDNLTPNFLFGKGDGNPKFSIQSVGQMYIWDIPFFTLGILFLFRRKNKNWWIIPAWLLIGIIPAGVARETPHALRIEGSLPTFQIFSAFGFIEFVNMTKKYKSLIILALLILVFNIFYFSNDYFTHYARLYSNEWQYGYKDSVAYALQNSNKYDKIKITTQLGRPYIYYLFYMKIDPQKFRDEAKVDRDVFGFVHVRSFEKYFFDDNMSKENNGKKILYINRIYDLTNKDTLLKHFYLLNGDTILIAYE